ncbi:MAG TPA: tRNA-uridine aminocarboxypropyltransferase [Bryobacteraceae bacterium]|nr:tRNA-uridine aminocarboxypropyltransferase [Bryobacteraceae bacterium]
MAGNECPKCLKRQSLCICEAITPLANKHHVLILQHPQEPDKELGSARIANLALQNSTLRVGLSWPNLSKALGRPVVQGDWGVLYLGSKSEKHPSRDRVAVLTKSGAAASLSGMRLDGIVVLDGTWAQAKTMWWRNAWLLKLKRLMLNPARPSLYGKTRREPRRECLSTIESIAETLDALGEDPKISESLRNLFSGLLRKYQDAARPPI